MAARGRPRRGGGSNLPLILGVGVVTTALLAYVIAIWATVDGIPAVVKGASANVGRAVLIRGAVMNVVPVPLTKAGAYAVGDQDTAIWVITTKGVPVVGDRWVVPKRLGSSPAVSRQVRHWMPSRRNSQTSASVRI